MAPVYASDPAYAQRVGWLIERYDLDRWDSMVNEVVDQEA
jgi:flagellum-specific peptidoglycan hydrolase FlgJ